MHIFCYTTKNYNEIKLILDVITEKILAFYTISCVFVSIKQLRARFLRGNRLQQRGGDDVGGQPQWSTYTGCLVHDGNSPSL